MKKMLLAFVLFFAFVSGAFAAINLNTATQAELDGVSGIGPVKAKAILDYRKKNGAFKSVDDLNNVPGFGEKTVAKVKSAFTVGNAAPAKKAANADAKKPAPAAK
jgi:competence protein ComEA